MSSSGDRLRGSETTPAERSELAKGRIQVVPLTASKNSQRSKSKGFVWKAFDPQTQKVNYQASGEEKKEKGEQVTPSLEFINVNSGLAAPDSRHEHRKAVRRHVMRNYHGRKKGKEDTNLPEKKERPLQNRRLARAAQPATETADSDPCHSHIGAHLHQSTSAVALEGEFEGRLDPPHRRSPRRNASLLSGDSSVTMQERAVSDNEVRSPTWDWMSADSVIPPVRGFLQQFDGWLYDTTVPFALVQSEDAPVLYITSRNWPFPQPLGNITPRTSIWMPHVKIPRPRLQPRSCMHKNMMVHPAICATKEYYSFKVDTIRWIEKRLPDASKGTNDATIGSILLLTTLESARGNVAESASHMNGLVRIINLRGGVHGFLGKSHFLIKVFLLDLIVAILGNRKPILGTLPTLLPPDILGPKQQAVPGSPLFCRGALKWSIDEQSFCQESIALLQHMQELTILASADADSAVLRKAAFEYIINLRTTQSSPPTVIRIIHLTATIYERALRQNPVPFSSSINHELARELCRALESPVHDTIWHRFPGVLLWILLTTNAVIDRSTPGYGFSVSLLTKVAMGAGYGWWEEMNFAMRAFLKIKMRAEGARLLVAS